MPGARGFSLVELMVGLAVSAILLMIAAPSMNLWLQNGQIRNVAEAMQSGLQLARAEAVRRNARVRFQLTNSVEAGCSVTATGNNWVVSLDDAAGQCAAGSSETDSPRIIQIYRASEGGRNAQVTAGQAVFEFNALGRLTQTTPVLIDIDIDNPATGSCRAGGGRMHCLRLEVTTNGQIRMCDPAAAATDARSC